MATQIYGAADGSTASVGQQTIVHYYDRAGIKAATRVNVYGQFADRRSMPTKYGKTFKISRFEHMYDRSFADGEFATKGYMTGRSLVALNALLDATDGTGVSLVEGAGSTNQRTLQKVTYETQYSRYGEMIEYTDEVEIWSEDYIQTRYREELGELANSRMEDLIQRDMLGTTTVIYGGAATSVPTVGGEITAIDTSEDDLPKVSYDLIRKSVRKLVQNRAKKNTSIVTGSTKIGTTPIAKAYYAIIGADVKADLETSIRGTVAANGTTEYVYLPVHKYAGAATLAEGEVGAMHEVRFIESESAIVYRGAGAVVPVGYAGGLSTTTITAAEATALAALTGGTYNSGEERFDVFPVLFPTEGAFATVGLKGHEKIKFNAKSPAQVENGNPYGTKGFFSYNFFYAGIILREEALLKMMVAAGA